ncbi:fimbrial protein [Escherichia coli]
MKLNRLLCVFLIAMLNINSAGASTKTLSSTLTINANFFAPSCDITVPSEHSLGLLTPGDNVEHNKINIEISCQGNDSYSTGLIASVIKGELNTSQTSVQMLVNDDKNGPFLSLKDEKNSLIKMTGNKSDAFCVGDSGKRNCSIIPVTNVQSNAIAGLVTAVIRFSIVHP